MATATSRVTLLEDICERLEGGHSFPALGTTTAAGDALRTTFVDSALAYADASTDALGQPIVRIDSSPTTFLAFSPAQTLNGAINASVTAITVSGTAIQNNAVLLIDTEQMLVTAGAGTTALAVTRGYGGTTAASHSNAAAITGAPASGVTSNVRLNGLTVASGSVLVSPSFPAPVPAGTSYSLWKLIHSKLAEDLLAKVLRSLKRETYYPVSVFADSDMETTGTADFAATTATLSKVTTALRVRSGVQSMRILAAAGVPRAETALVTQVRAREQWLVSAKMMADVGTATLIAYRSTATAAAIQTGSHTEEAWCEIELPPFAIPSGCEEMTVRMQGVGASDDLYADELIAWPTMRNRFYLPSWVDDPNQDVLELGYWERGRSIDGSTYGYAVEEGKWRPWPYTIRPDRHYEGAAQPFWVEFATPVTRPLFLRLLRPFGALASDTATTTADRNLVVGLTLREVYSYLETEAAKRGDKDLQVLWRAERAKVENEAAVKGYLTRHSGEHMKVIYPRRSG